MTLNDGKRYCTYCRLRKPEEGFTQIRDRLGRLRNRKCGDCSGMKRLPPEEREAASKRRQAEKKMSEHLRMVELTERRMDRIYKRSEE